MKHPLMGRFAPLATYRSAFGVTVRANANAPAPRSRRVQSVGTLTLTRKLAGLNERSQMRKIATLLTLSVGFLLGSRAGRAPWDRFIGTIAWVRESRFVSRPIDATAEKLSEIVRRRGTAIADRAADVTYARISRIGQRRAAIEARIVGVDVDDLPEAAVLNPTPHLDRASAPTA